MDTEQSVLFEYPHSDDAFSCDGGSVYVARCFAQGIGVFAANLVDNVSVADFGHFFQYAGVGLRDDRYSGALLRTCLLYTARCV